MYSAIHPSIRMMSRFLPYNRGEIERATPQDVATGGGYLPGDAVDVFAGDHHTCLRLQDKPLVCFGANN